MSYNNTNNRSKSTNSVIIYNSLVLIGFVMDRQSETLELWL